MVRTADLGSLFPPLVERRRAPRLPSELWLRVHGVETRARLRTGDLSARGLHAVLDLPVGGPGDLVSLRLATADRRHGAEVLARVTRVLREDDLHHGAAVLGACFEFLPRRSPSPELLGLVCHEARLSLGRLGTVPLRGDAPLRLTRPDRAPQLVRVRCLAPGGLVVATAGPLTAGEAVQASLPGDAGADPGLRAVVASTSTPAMANADARHLAVLRLDPGAEGGELPDGLLRSLLDPPATEASSLPPLDLSAQLARVSLAAVLELAEQERLDGIVTVATERSSARLYVSGGRTIDAECDHARLPAAAVLAEALSWTEGELGLSSVQVRRPDRLETSATELLLEARSRRGVQVA